MISLTRRVAGTPMTDAPRAIAAGEPMTCGAARALLWDYIGRELGPDLAAAVCLHLEACPSCEARHDYERAFLAAVGTARASDPAPPSLRWRVTGLLRDRGLLS